MKKTYFLSLLKAIITILLIIYVLNKINFNEFGKIIAKLDLSYLLLLFAVTIMQSLINNKAWQIALSAYKIIINYFKLLFYYYVGAFYSLSLPGTIGGDVVKAYLVGKDENRYKESLSSLIVQRSIGLLVFITFLVIPATIFSKIISRSETQIIVSIILVACVSLCILVFYSKTILNIFKYLLRRISIFGIGNKVIKLIDTVLVFENKKQIIIRLILTSIFVYLTSLLLRYIVYRSLDLQIDLFYFFSLVIYVSFLTQIPISFAGIGIREGSYVYFFSKIGISPEIALTFSLLEFLPSLIINITAGLLYFTREIKISIIEISSKRIKN